MRNDNRESQFVLRHGKVYRMRRRDFRAFLRALLFSLATLPETYGTCVGDVADVSHPTAFLVRTLLIKEIP